MKSITRRHSTLAREQARRVAERLARDDRAQLIYLFGSAADLQRESVRDVDLGVLCDPPIDPDELLRLRADAVAGIGIEVDLVDLRRASVVLAHEVASTGCACSRAHRMRRATSWRARSRFLDFKPFLEEQWRLLGERLEERSGGSSSGVAGGPPVEVGGGGVAS